jgi:hypothetical protein
LKQRRPGIDHGGKDAGKDHHFLFRHLLLEEGKVLHEVFGLALDIDGPVALTPEHPPNDCLVRAVQFALLDLAFPVRRFPQENRHAYTPRLNALNTA